MGRDPARPKASALSVRAAPSCPCSAGQGSRLASAERTAPQRDRCARGSVEPAARGAGPAISAQRFSPPAEVRGKPSTLARVRAIHQPRLIRHPPSWELCQAKLRPPGPRYLGRQQKQRFTGQGMTENIAHRARGHGRTRVCSDCSDNRAHFLINQKPLRLFAAALLFFSSPSSHVRFLRNRVPHISLVFREGTSGRPLRD